jgi:cytochrome c oxidase assembly protein subunit 15
VVVLGAYVRLTAAGLGCPDWPGCYGHLTPLGAQQSAAASATLDVGKAWREMIHRYAASSLVLTIVLIAALTLSLRDRSPVSRAYAVALLGIVVLQAALGMLTVTWQLTPLIVTLHLIFGLTTLALLWWLHLSLEAGARGIRAAPRGAGASSPSSNARATARGLAILALVVLAGQIALGGWTSSNYAAIACPDFPTCQNAWWPAMDYSEGFVLWRAPGINYTGGVLANPARVAIHFTHRLGAVAAACALLVAALVVLRDRSLEASRTAAAVVVLALLAQLTIGITMVLRGFPLWLATAHNAGAAFTLLAVIALVHGLRADARHL